VEVLPYTVFWFVQYVLKNSHRFSLYNGSNCPHNEMKLKQNSFKTVLKPFCFSFVSLCGQFYYVRLRKLLWAYLYYSLSL